MIVFLTEHGRVGLIYSDYGLLSLKLPGDLGSDVALTEIPDYARSLVDRIKDYYLGKMVDFTDVVLDESHISSFAALVYKTLIKNVRYGMRLSYSELASLCGRDKAARAVGTALAKNPWPLVVPCHRVLGAGGKLGGFSGAGGIAQKQQMLDMESRQV